MYTYKFKGKPNETVKFDIKTPEVPIEEIKHHEHKTNEMIESHFIYPNGLDLFTRVTPGEIEIISNKEIIVDKNMQMTFKD